MGCSLLCFNNVETQPLSGVSRRRYKVEWGVEGREPRQPGPEPHVGTALGKPPTRGPPEPDWRRRRVGSKHLESSKLSLTEEMPWDSMAGLSRV